MQLYQSRKSLPNSYLPLHITLSQNPTSGDQDSGVYALINRYTYCFKPLILFQNSHVPNKLEIKNIQYLA